MWTMVCNYQQVAVYREHKLVINQMIIILLLLFLCGSCCPVGEYYNSITLQCVACGPYCQSCVSSSSCLTCSQGAYLQGTVCVTCPAACSGCINGVVCTSCSNGFYFNASSSICQSCSFNCFLCSSNSCNKCNSGFYPSGSNCILCLTSCDCSEGTLQNCHTSPDGMLTVVIAVPIVVIVSFFLVFSIIRNQCQQNQNKPSELNDTQNDDSNTIAHGLRLIGVMLNMQKKNWISNQNGEKIEKREVCSICLHRKVNLKTKCNHSFHMKCLYKWLKENQTCPMCKRYCVKKLKKYCKICFRNYIEFNSNLAFKYNVSIFDICPQCQGKKQVEYPYG